MVLKKNWISMRGPLLTELLAGIEVWRNDFPEYYGIDIHITEHGIEDEAYFVAQIYYLEPRS